MHLFCRTISVIVLTYYFPYKSFFLSIVYCYNIHPYMAYLVHFSIVLISYISVFVILHYLLYSWFWYLLF